MVSRGVILLLVIPSIYLKLQTCIQKATPHRGDGTLSYRTNYKSKKKILHFPIVIHFIFLHATIFIKKMRIKKCCTNTTNTEYYLLKNY
jgi:hypothetical protein